MTYKNEEYAYTIGRIRVLETRLMNSNLIERMIDAPTPQDAFRVLNDISYLSGVIGEYTVNDFQIVLLKGFQSMARLLTRMAPYPEVIDNLWLKYDFHNLKVVLKARLTDRSYADVEHALIDMGSRSKSDWEEYLLTGKIESITEYMSEFVQTATLHFEKNNDIQSVDTILDKCFIEEMQNFAKSLNSQLITDYYKRLIDFNNIRTFIRSEILKTDKESVSQMFIEGGILPVSILISSYEKGYADLLQTLSQKVGFDDFAASIESFSKENTLLSIEKKIAELQTSFMDESKKMPFGPEPVFAFFWRFENSLQIIRAILVGKLNGLPTEDIKKHVLSI